MAADAEKVEVFVSNLLKISPFGVIPSDIIKTVYMLYWVVHVLLFYIVNESISN